MRRAAKWFIGQLLALMLGSDCGRIIGELLGFDNSKSFAPSITFLTVRRYEIVAQMHCACVRAALEIGSNGLHGAKIHPFSVAADFDVVRVSANSMRSQIHEFTFKDVKRSSLIQRG